ncbi:MAG: B12-binding domain-containing radical SAM protein [Candidatus Omnitrophica bacterium]|nr:B12-binding domain-containing radical SAM protein [Candidatus Omnitrophota bacterium]
MILINPRSTKFGIFERYIPLSVPIGIGYLAGYLIHRNKEVEILDEHIRPISERVLAEAVKKFLPPYIFGISSLTACINRSFEIAKVIKTIYPDSKIVLGGIHPTVLPEEVLGNKYVDFVVRREGEEVIDELYQAIKDNIDYSKIKGISFRVNHHIVHNPPALSPSLNKMPPYPYYLFEEYKDKYNLGFIMSSRGCPYDCIFCSQRAISGREYRYVPTDVVIGELELLINKYKQTHINFVDDNFTTDRKRIKELSEKMIEREFYKKATFDCQTRADAVDDEILILLKQAGFRLINFGLETASERLMVLLNKKETVKENIEGVRLAKKYGFGVSATFIFGLPSERREERLQAYRLAKELSLDYARFNNATPYPGTRLYEIAKEENRLFIEKNWTNLNACATLVEDALNESRLPYVPTTCKEIALKKEVLKANLLFSLRPTRVLKLLVKRIGPAGWFYLPPLWYLKPKEWFFLIRLGFKLFALLVNLYMKSLFQAQSEPN